MYSWKAIVLSITSIQFIFETYIELRQDSHLDRSPRCKSRSKSTRQDIYVKSLAYSQAHLRYTLWHRLYNYVIDCSILYWNGYSTLWDTTGLALLAWLPIEYVSFFNQSVAFIYACFLIDTLLNMPWVYYLHFHLEERFGFNKLSISLWLADLLKTQLIQIVVVLALRPSIILFHYFGEIILSGYGLPAFICQLLVSLLFPSLVTFFFTLVPLPTGPLQQKIQELCQRIGFRLSSVKVINGSKRTAHSNAYISGRLRKEVVLFDTLVTNLADDEIVAVVAHELGHWKLGHAVRLQIPIQMRMLAIANLARLLWMNTGLYGSFGFQDHAGLPVVVGALLMRKFFTPFDMLTKLLLHAQSRKYEFEADAFSARMGYGAALSSALTKTSEQNLVMSDVDWLYSTYHHTHPSLPERLQRLGLEVGDEHDKHI